MNIKMDTLTLCEFDKDNLSHMKFLQNMLTDNSIKERFQGFLPNLNKKTYGFSLGKHPLDGYTNKDIKDFNNNDVINIIGIVKKITRKIDKNGNEMAFLDMENKECAYRGVAFARTYSKYKGILLEGMKLSLNGKKDGNSILINICERI